MPLFLFIIDLYTPTILFRQVYLAIKLNARIQQENMQKRP